MPQPDIRLIRVLSDDTARRIAAGEVIDRPAAVLRELLDNAIDSGAAEITASLEDGGNARIRVQDDGRGMTPDDLALCGRPHATSKIAALEDLDRLTTLGFRGEALASIAACARLEISSTAVAKRMGGKVVLEGGRPAVRETTGPLPGTTVDVSKLFFNMPARRQFLKRPQTEGTLCKAVFIEKALAHPETGFRLWSDGKMTLYLPPAPLAERVALAHEKNFPADFLETSIAAGEGFRLTAVCSGPEASRPDRKYIQIFVNRRRIYEFSLLQAVEYGFEGYLPGGLKPIAFVFIDIDPALVDFNIHPAKREARFRNLPAVRSGLGACLRSFLRKKRALPPAPSSPPDDGRSILPFDDDSASFRPGSPTAAFSRMSVADTLRVSPGRIPSLTGDPGPDGGGLRYLGQIGNVYLAGALGDELILVDQHAAHERLLFDELEGKPVVKERLAIPIAFELEEDEREAFAHRADALADAGFDVVRTGGGRSCELTALPSLLAAAPADELIGFLKGTLGDARDPARRARALAACRAAVKEGTALDPVSARELMQKALALPDPHCPHGRPVIVRFPRPALDRLFQRLV